MSKFYTYNGSASARFLKLGFFEEVMSSGWAMLDVKKDDSVNPLAKAVAEELIEDRCWI